MKSKIVVLLSIVICALSFVFGAVSCGEDEIDTYYNLEATGTVYFDGDQSVTLSFSEVSDKPSEFKADIDVKDVSLSGALSGKRVERVEFVDGQHVKIALAGRVKADKAQSDAMGTITVSHSAIENGANGAALIRVDFEPKMTRTFNSFSTATKRYVSEYTLPYGMFLQHNVNSAHIDVPVSGVTVNLSVTAKGALRIEVVGFEPFESNGITIGNPIARLDETVTTFNKILYVSVGDTNMFAEYDLV